MCLEQKWKQYWNSLTKEQQDIIMGKKEKDFTFEDYQRMQSIKHAINNTVNPINSLKLK